jgi:hypothetical protein
MNELAAFWLGLILMGILWYWVDYHEKTSAYQRGFEAGRKSATPKWIPTYSRPPFKDEMTEEMVLVCYKGHIRFGSYMDGEWSCNTPDAWMPLPAPWKENGAIHSGLYER